MKFLNTFAEEKKIADRIMITGHDFNRQRDLFNPYKGLLDQADHVIVYGPSRSILSERIKAKKSVYMHQFFLPDWDKLGLSHDFNEWPEDKPLETHTVDLPNVTELVADGVIQRWRELLESRHIPKAQIIQPQPA